MSGSRQPAIAAVGLRKSFDETAVLDGVEVDVAPGTVFALLRPNGSGKVVVFGLAAHGGVAAGQAPHRRFTGSREAAAISISFPPKRSIDKNLTRVNQRTDTARAANTHLSWLGPAARTGAGSVPAGRSTRRLS
jgi:ABC-type branched-subunit amino acid transport system ATPase component